MKSALVTINTETGLHSRPADLFVRTAKLYQSAITVYHGEKSADAKNIIKVILLNVPRGGEIQLRTEGSDEDVAIQDLRNLVESDFTRVNGKVQL